MQTTVNTVVAKFAVAFVAVAMMFTLVAPASAQNVEDMSLEELIALVTQLQASLGQADDSMSGSSSDVCPYTWTRTLNMGSTGADVMMLQKFLNSMPETMVAVSGAGSIGNETSYYGPATGAAVANFQMKYRAEILSPLGLVNATTFFGNATMAQANALCLEQAIEEEVEEEVEEELEEETPGSQELGNDEGSIESDDKVSADESNLEEGQEGGVLAFTLEIDGDVEVNRIDFYAEAEDGSSYSDDADDYFENASLWVDGEKVATMDVDEFDDDEDWGEVANGANDDQEYRLRFSSLGLVFEDGDEPEFQLAFEVRSSLDSADLAGDWDVEADDIRFVDGQGFTDTYTVNETEQFGFDAEEVAELDISEAGDSPDGRTLEVDEDDESEEIELFVFEIEEENGVDVTIDDLTLTASTTNIDVTTTVDEVILMMGSTELGSESPTTAGVLNFENLGIEIDADEKVELTAVFVFNGTDDYTEGDEVFVTFTSIDDAEDENGNDEGDMTITGTPTSDTFSLRSEGVALEMTSDSFTLKANADGVADDQGVFTYKFDVTAFGDDFYFNKTASRGTTGTTTGAEFVIVSDGGGTVVTTGTTTFSLTSTADTQSGDYVVNSGDTETFTLKVTFDPLAEGFYGVQLGGVNYTLSAGGTTFTAQAATPAEDFLSAEESI